MEEAWTSTVTGDRLELGGGDRPGSTFVTGPVGLLPDSRSATPIHSSPPRKRSSQIRSGKRAPQLRNARQRRDQRLESLDQRPSSGYRKRFDLEDRYAERAEGGKERFLGFGEKGRALNEGAARKEETVIRGANKQTHSFRSLLLPF